MKLYIHAYPKAGENSIEKRENGELSVFVKEPPLNNRANHAIVRLIADYFNVSANRVRIVSGHRTRKKLLEVQKEELS